MVSGSFHSSTSGLFRRYSINLSWRGRVSEHSFSPSFALVTRGYRWKDKVWPGQDKFVHGWRVNTRLDGRAQCCMQRDIEPNEKQKDQCSVIILRCQRVRWKAVQDDIFALVVRDFHCPASNFFFLPKKDFSLFIYFKQREGMIKINCEIYIAVVYTRYVVGASYSFVIIY